MILTKPETQGKLQTQMCVQPSSSVFLLSCPVCLLGLWDSHRGFLVSKNRLLISGCCLLCFAVSIDSVSECTSLLIHEVCDPHPATTPTLCVQGLGHRTGFVGYGSMFLAPGFQAAAVPHVGWWDVFTWATLTISQPQFPGSEVC